MHAYEEERSFPEFVLRWWEEGDRLHEDPALAAAVTGETVASESFPIWLFAVWTSLVSLLIVSSL